MQKIISIELLAEKVKAEKEKGHIIVHCHGVFDLLHIGHIRYLEQARRMGDILGIIHKASKKKSLKRSQGTFLGTITRSDMMENVLRR